MDALVLALVIVAGVLAVVELVRSRAGSLLAWGLLAVALAGLVPALSGL
jgi:hypothetical protein